jgi:Fe-Mn family superoxide dismutase
MTLKFIQEVILGEGKSERLQQVKLPYNKDGLDPVMSQDTINYHYGKLYKGYVDRFNKKEGDLDFNEAGAFLHKLYFEQFREPQNTNPPEAEVDELITKNYKTFDSFKDAVSEEAMKIQGSGWIYLSKNGQIKVIKNHAIRSDIVLLIDWWEHAWALDYQADKGDYLKNIWRIINWPIINTRLT